MRLKDEKKRDEVALHNYFANICCVCAEEAGHVEGIQPADLHDKRTGKHKIYMSTSTHTCAHVCFTLR